MNNQHAWAFSTVALLVGLGGSVGLYGGCSAGNGGGGGVDAAMCDPDSGDTVGCPCDSNFHPGACYTGPPGSSSNGICTQGTRTCVNGVQTACMGEVTPQPEVCNLADDDCNGIIDDVPEIKDAAVLTTCTSPACAMVADDAAITCWGPDNGMCGAGQKSCIGGAKEGTPTGCNELLHMGAMEVCNGLDDDCNGVIDDGLTMDGPCTLDAGALWSGFPDADLTNLGKADGSLPTDVRGECLNGNLSCVDQSCPKTGPNATRLCYDAGDQCFPSTPVAEICNGKDDDCNGLVDDHACASDPAHNYWCCIFGSSGFCESSNNGGCIYAN